MKRKVIFLLLVLFSASIAIGESSFNIFDDKVINGDKMDNSNGTNVVTFDYNDGGFTNDYYYCFSSSKTKINANDIPKPNVDESKHKFIGWFLEKDTLNNNLNSYKVDFSNHEFKDGDVVYAKYASVETTYDNIQSDINILPSSTKNPHYISSSSYSNTLNLSKKINLCFADSDGYYDENKCAETSNTESNKIRLVSNAKVYAVLDTDLVIQNGGVLQINAVLGYKSKTNGFNQLISTDEYTALDLNGYTIKIENGGQLNGYGIIFNSKSTGGIVVESGGQLTTPYCIGDFKGGGYLTTSYHDGIMSFGSFACPYLSCETLFKSGARLIGCTSLNASDVKYTTNVPLIGENEGALIQLKDGYIIHRSTDYCGLTKNRTLYSLNSWTMDDLFSPQSYREQLIFTNNVNNLLDSITNKGFEAKNKANVIFNSLELSIKMGFSATVSMKYGDFPIPSFFDIKLYNTTFSFKVSLVAMPSSTIYIDENSIISMGNDSNFIYARLSVIDEYPFDYYYLNSSGNIKYLANSWMQNVVTYQSKKANIVMNGKFEIDTSNVDMNNSYSYYTIGGYIDCSAKAINSLIAKQDYIKLETRFYYPIWMTPKSGDYSHGAGRYYTKPLISNGNVYIQLNDNNIIKKGYIYDDDSSLYVIENKIYFYNFFNKQFQTNIRSKTSLAIDKNPATKSDIKRRLDNTDGSFVECSLSDMDKIIKPVNDSNYYAFVCGAYISLGNEITKKNDKIAIASSEDNKFSLTGFDNYKCASYIIKDLYYDRWVFTI